MDQATLQTKYNGGRVGIGTSSPQSLSEAHNGNFALTSISSPSLMLFGGNSFVSKLLPNGNVFVAEGGNDAANVFISTTQIYNPQTGAWALGPNSPNSIMGAMSAMAPSGEVAQFGGTVSPNECTTTNVVQFYTSSGTWGTAANLPNTADGMFAVTLQNGTLLFGAGNRVGYTGSCINNGQVSTTWLYNPATNIYASTGSLNTARGEPGAVLMPSGQVIVFGGGTWNGGNTITSALASSEIFNPLTGVWTSTSSMTTGRINPSYTLLPNGNILVVGGQNGAGAWQSSAEIFYSTAGAWAAIPSAPFGAGSNGVDNTSSIASGMYVLSNGEVLLYGGGYGPADAPSAAVFNPSNNSWTLIPNYPISANSVSGQVLPNGEAFLFGGYVSGSVAVSTTALYDYAFNAWASSVSFSYGVSLSSNGFVNAPVGTSLAVSSSPATPPLLTLFSNGHLTSDGGTPSVASGTGDCGTSPSIKGTDVSGSVTVGTSTNGGKCTVTFANAWQSAPNCVTSDGTTGNLVRPASVSTTTIAITGTLTAGDKLYFLCIGN